MEQEEPQQPTGTETQQLNGTKSKENQNEENPTEAEAEATAVEDADSKPPVPTFNFDFDDEKPKKKKKKSKGKKGKKTQKSYSREYYEALIPELNSKLADLRRKFVGKEKVNLELIAELTKIEEDRVDVCEYLVRTIDKRKKQIVELEKSYVQIEEEYENYKVTSRERIEELQKMYARDEKQLKGEIELQERALSSLDEFRTLRNAALERYQTTADQVEELERQCKEDLFNLEQKNAVQKNVLKKEVEMRLHQVVEDFMHSNEIRNAGYTRNLIRENITLQKTMDRRVKQNIYIMEEREKQFLKTKEIMEAYASLEQFSAHLKLTIANKDEIIHRLTGNIERLKMKFVDARRYRNLCEQAIEKDLLKAKLAPAQDFNDMQSYLQKLRTDKTMLNILCYLQEGEIRSLRQLLDKLMMAVDSAVSVLDESKGCLPLLHEMSDSEIMELRRILRRNIIAELIPIVSGNSSTALQLPKVSESQHKAQVQVYRPGVCGFIPPPPHRCCEVEERNIEACSSTKCDSLVPSQSDKSSNSSLTGVEFGSYCFYSHTPTVESSSMLSPIEECNSAWEVDNKRIATGPGERIGHKRCSCPKKRFSTASIIFDDFNLKTSLQFKEPQEIMVKKKRSMGKLGQRCYSCCFGLDCYPYCSDSSSVHNEKETKTYKVSF